LTHPEREQQKSILKSIVSSKLGDKERSVSLSKFKNIGFSSDKPTYPVSLLIHSNEDVARFDNNFLISKAK